jgi:hypothetical protein
VNIPGPIVLKVINDQFGRSFDKDKRARREDQIRIYLSVCLLSNLKRLVFKFVVSIEFILHSDLTWTH